MARGITKPPAKKNTPNLLKELETDLNPESTNPSSNKQQKHPRYQVSWSKNIRVRYPYNTSNGFIWPRELYNSISWV
jgi:hypothetical protein